MTLKTRLLVSFILAIAAILMPSVGQAEIRHGTSHKAMGSGIGSLSAKTPGGERAELVLRRLYVDARRDGDLVQYHVTHTFHHPGDMQLEGTFHFPLPPGASVVGVAMDVAGRMMEGELLERQKARKIYRKIVDAMQDPAIVEWEGNQSFKLRVFPIEPGQDKTVVIRLSVPLESHSDGLRAIYPTSAPALETSIETFQFHWNGRPWLDVFDFEPGEPVVVPVDDTDDLNTVLEETHASWTYLRARLTPTWAPTDTSNATSPLSPRDLLLVVDTSRSALEERALITESITHLLGTLGPDDRFLVLTSDVTTHAHAPDFQWCTDENLALALDFYAGITPDGASDLEAAIAAVNERLVGHDASPVQVVYIGDGNPTWGERSDQHLSSLMTNALGPHTFHALLLGKEKNHRLLKVLTGRHGGRYATPRFASDVHRFAMNLQGDQGRDRLRNVRVKIAPGADVYPDHPMTLFPGDALPISIRATSTMVPNILWMTGTYRGQPFEQAFDISNRRAGQHVAHRWGLEHLHALEIAEAPKAERVQTSLAHGVLSKHTAFLVLESEEAYARHQVARRQEKDAKSSGPRISGADLESLGERQARLSPDHIQPGDPEIRIPAPQQARSVAVVLPTGESLVAAWNHVLKAWVVRFLIDLSTPDGSYSAEVCITHADGTIERFSLPYTVDTTAPKVILSVRPHRRLDGVFVIAARQRITAIDLDQQIPHWRRWGSLRRATRRLAHIVEDVRRVEVQTPDGQILRLSAVKSGHFQGHWTPREDPEGPLEFTVISADVALNLNRTTQTLTLGETENAQ